VKMLPTGVVGLAGIALILAALWLVAATHDTDAGTGQFGAIQSVAPSLGWN
jgi:hypothetical protein